MKEAGRGRRVGGEAPAKSRGVDGGRAVGDKAAGRWCLVRGLRGRSLDFLPLTQEARAASLGSIHMCREDKMGGDPEGKGRQWE